MKKIIICFLLSLTLPSCTAFWPYHSDHKCSVDSGKKCKSLKEIDDMVDNNEL